MPFIYLSRNQIPIQGLCQQLQLYAYRKKKVAYNKESYNIELEVNQEKGTIE